MIKVVLRQIGPDWQICMWSVDHLICMCNFQQICNFLICGNLQFKNCKIAFFPCKLVKIRECTLDILTKVVHIAHADAKGATVDASFDLSTPLSGP